MAAKKETVEPVAQEQTIHVHDASGDEHIQPKLIARSTPAMVLEAMAKMVPESVELVAQDEAIEATSTAKSSTSEEEVAAPTAEDVGDAAEKNDAQSEAMGPQDLRYFPSHPKSSRYL
ncbi:hypothetical protein V6N13_059362 [Hibiscus sabdariffa]